MLFEIHDLAGRNTLNKAAITAAGLTLRIASNGNAVPFSVHAWQAFDHQPLFAAGIGKFLLRINLGLVLCNLLLPFGKRLHVGAFADVP